MSFKTNQPKSKPQPIVPATPPPVDATIVDLEQVTSGTVHWLEQNQKIVLGALVGVLAVIGGYFWYGNYKTKQNEKALVAVFRAEQKFEQDSFQAALSNPGGGFSGLTDISSKYSSTNVGSAASYQAAVAYMNIGKFDEAIQYLERFSPEGHIGPTMKYGLLGDAWSEKKDFAKALKYYKQAGSTGGVDELKAYYLKKAGLLSEVQKDYVGALGLYKEIKNNYPTTTDGNGIDKYILRAQVAKK